MVADGERRTSGGWSGECRKGGKVAAPRGEPECVVVQIVVCDGWKGKIDPHVDREVGVIAGPSMASGRLCCDAVENCQIETPAGDGDGSADREEGGVVPARLVSEAGVGVASRASGEALFVQASTVRGH